jgi:pimeloyl-ACP methyl ester carboxylesterase
VSVRRYELRIRGVEHDGHDILVILDRTRQTSAHGRYTLLFEEGGWAQLAEDVVGRGPNRVARRVTKLSDLLAPSVGDRISWSGIYFANPREADLVATDVRLSTPAGNAPAWRIDGDGERGQTWAIHIHGLGSPRLGPIRGVRVATCLGFTSLVVSYRNDGEGPRAGSGRNTLGDTEAFDVEVALQYALDHGAQRIVLFGWSMGAAIALQLASRDTWREHISALVLESPVLDWLATLKANCRRAGLPPTFALLAVPWLTLAPVAKAIGLPNRIPLSSFNWIARARELSTPALVLHGTRDDSAPLKIARVFAEHRPDLVQLEEFDAGHTMTWNADPRRWHAVVSDWLNAHLPPS